MYFYQEGPYEVLSTFFVNKSKFTLFWKISNVCIW